MKVTPTTFPIHIELNQGESQHLRFILASFAQEERKRFVAGCTSYRGEFAEELLKAFPPDPTY